MLPPAITMSNTQACGQASVPAGTNKSAAMMASESAVWMATLRSISFFLAGYVGWVELLRAFTPVFNGLCETRLSQLAAIRC